MKTPIEKLINCVDSIKSNIEYEVEAVEDQINKLLDEDNRFVFPLDISDTVSDVQEHVSNVEDYILNLQKDLEDTSEKLQAVELAKEKELVDYDNIKNIISGCSKKNKEVFIRILISEGVFDDYEDSWIASLLAIDQSEFLDLIDKTKAMR